VKIRGTIDGHPFRAAFMAMVHTHPKTPQKPRRFRMGHPLSWAAGGKIQNPHPFDFPFGFAHGFGKGRVAHSTPVLA
jgi:hypothetical protein